MTLRFRGTFAGGPKTVKINRPVTQASIIIGHEGISRDNRDFYALSVMNYILGGGGFAARLFEEIRNRRGLAYSVASYFDPRKYPGSFQIALQTKNVSAGKAMEVALKEMKKIRRKPVRRKELEAAKKYLIGSFPMRVDTQDRLARFIGQVEYYGLGLDYPDRYPSLIGAVTRGDVRRVARDYLHPEKCLTVIVADLKAAGLEEKTEAEKAGR
jgi:zinc protease